MEKKLGRIKQKQICLRDSRIIIYPGKSRKANDENIVMVGRLKEIYFQLI